jgi:hypothetical protein
MLKVLQRGSTIVAVIATILVFATSGLAQLPGSPWKKAWPFPEPDEELYGVATGGNGSGRSPDANCRGRPVPNN